MGVGVNYGSSVSLYNDGQHNMIKRRKAGEPNIYSPSVNSNGLTGYASYNQVSERGNSCTDGKDDGKLNCLEIVSNVGEGIFKGFCNNLKGLVFDGNGNVSIGKIALTAGMGVLCTAFPVVGLGLACAGIASGGTKVVKSVIKANTSKTDSEAKDALEELGEGGLTLGLSVWGAKASVNAISKSAASYTKYADTFSKSKFTDGSALTKLQGEKFNALEYAKALGHDIGASTGNGVQSVKASWGSLVGLKKATHNPEYVKQVKLAKKLGASGTEGADSWYGVTEARANYGETYLGKLGHEIGNLKNNANPINLVKGAWNGLKGIPEVVRTTASTFQQGGMSGVANAALSKLGTTGTNILNALTSGEYSYNQLVSEYGYNNVLEVLNILGITMAENK